MLKSNKEINFADSLSFIPISVAEQPFDLKANF
jgi:hypothetical protein